MSWNEERLNAIYNKTDGKCHICGKKLSFTNYNSFGKKGAWEVEHSIPKAKGGSDHLNNLYAACITCNREKRDSHTRTARKKNGRKAAPLSREKKKKNKIKNALGLGVVGTVVGGLLGGPSGAVVGSLIGGAIGSEIDPDSK